MNLEKAVFLILQRDIRFCIDLAHSELHLVKKIYN